MDKKKRIFYEEMLKKTEIISSVNLIMTENGETTEEEINKENGNSDKINVTVSEFTKMIEDVKIEDKDIEKELNISEDSCNSLFNCMLSVYLMFLLGYGLEDLLLKESDRYLES